MEIRNPIPIDTRHDWIIRRKGTTRYYCTFDFFDVTAIPRAAQHATSFQSQERAEHVMRILEPGGVGLEAVHVRITVEEIVRVVDDVR